MGLMCSPENQRLAGEEIFFWKLLRDKAVNKGIKVWSRLQKASECGAEEFGLYPPCPLGSDTPAVLLPSAPTGSSPVYFVLPDSPSLISFRVLLILPEAFLPLLP